MDRYSSYLFICTGPTAKEYHMTALSPLYPKVMQDDTSLIEDMSDTDIKTQLLMSDLFTFTFSVSNVITDVFRDQD